jgi:hypothetical protein
MTSEPQGEENVAEEQAEKLQLAIEKIVPFCNEDAEQEAFRKIGAALKEGDELLGESLEGSTNFSYKVFLKGDPDVKIFVKIAFDFARWNPDRSAHYDLARITAEFNMMQKFSDLLGDNAPVALPYICMDIAPKIRMMVAQWAPSHEAWGQQFVRGEVDRRIILKVAQFIARVNLEEYGDPNLNDGIKDSMRAIYPICKGAFAQMIAGEGEPPDHFVAYAREIGQERFSESIDAMAEAYEKCDCLLHGDAHVINILVEPFSKDNKFGPKGEFFLCDWEMVHAGDKGRDTGTFMAWPILSAYFLAVRGQKEKAYQVLDSIVEFWDIYSSFMVEKGNKDEKYMLEAYRSTIGWCGVYAFIANYVLKAQQGYMPFDLVSEAAGATAMASLALTGVKCLECGFLNVEPEFSVKQVQNWFTELISGQIELLLEI